MATPCKTLFPLLFCVTSVTFEKPPYFPFSPPSSAPPSRASQQPRERHVRLAPLSEQQAPEKINLPRFTVSSAKPQLEALALLFPLSLTLLSLSIHPFSISIFHSLSRTLSVPFITPLPSVHNSHHRFGNVTVRQSYSDVIVLIMILGRKRDSPLTCVASGLVWLSVRFNLHAACLV